jgi:hypothetical protein
MSPGGLSRMKSARVRPFCSVSRAWGSRRSSLSITSPAVRNSAGGTPAKLLCERRPGTINALSAGAAGVPRGHAARRTRRRTREGPFGVGKGEGGQRDRAGPASILFGRGLAVKEAVKERVEGWRGGPGVPASVRGCRPAVPTGTRGWGAKGDIDLEKLKALAH